MFKRLVPFFLTAILLLTACDLISEKTADEPPLTSVPEIPTPANTPVLASTPATAPPLAPPSRSITLTVWTVPEFSSASEAAGSSVLIDQVNAFDQSHPDLSVVVEAKTVADQGGALNYLRTGRNVAPDILPDVLLLPTDQLVEAARQQLIFPLEDLGDTEGQGDLFAAAQELVTVEGSIYGYPVGLTNLQHLVYNSSVITETLTTSWNQLLDNAPGTLAFAAAGPPGAELTLQFYLANGGTLQTESGQTTLELEPLTAALTSIVEGRSAGLINPDSGNAISAEQAWRIFTNTPDAMVQTDARFYFWRQAEGETDGLRVAPLAGPDGALNPLVSGWAWTLTTPDPARQALAVELVTWLASPQNVGEWTLENGVLPASDAAFEFWPEDDPFVQFLRRQLALARPFPSAANNAVMTSLAAATSDVVLQLSTPEAAAAEVAATQEQ
jgi:ABC-type glycerol-3-phosphate transport system substrate-binding protein